MKKLSLIIASFICFSCDAPRRTQAPVNFVNDNSLSPPSSGTVGGGDLSQTTGSATSGSGTGGSQPGFDNCDLTHKYHTIPSGHFGLCQSMVSETNFKINPGQTVSSFRICFIPTYKDSTGSSTYIGNPQCTFTQSGKIITGILPKDRQGFGHYPINGVMVMPEGMLNEYIGCMHGFIHWPNNQCPPQVQNSYCAYWKNQCPNSTVSAACSNEARNYMNSLCNNFKQKYYNSYLDIRLK